MKYQKEHIILNTSNLSIGYQQKKNSKIVANHINLSAKRGKFIALLGENGIGKSTLLRTIAKVQKPISGNVYINQKELNSYTNKELASILSLVLTERLPESQLTVFELVALGRQPYTNWIDTFSKKDVEKVNWALTLTAIEHLKNNRFYELSDGQLQRVLIARALAQDTEIIILDEPTAHLDMRHTFKVFSLLKRLTAVTNKTIIISTHQINLALQLVDECILMFNKKVSHGTVKELIKNNSFNELFPSDLITFNKTLQQFIIKKN